MIKIKHIYKIQAGIEPQPQRYKASVLTTNPHHFHITWQKVPQLLRGCENSLFTEIYLLRKSNNQFIYGKC